LVACVDLFESEPVPAKQKLCKHIAYITAGYQGTQTSFPALPKEQKNHPKTVPN